MTDAWGSLLVEVWDDEIVITLPASIYSVTYYRPANSAGLLARNFPKSDDHRVPMTQGSSSREAGSSPMKRRASWGGLCSPT
jgi:hypothetical protein